MRGENIGSRGKLAGSPHVKPGYRSPWEAVELKDGQLGPVATTQVSVMEIFTNPGQRANFVRDFDSTKSMVQ